MPMVTIDWLAGRSTDQKQAVAARVTAALEDECGVAAETVWVVFRDVSPTDWAAGGRLVSETRPH